MIKARNLIDFTETDYSTCWRLLELYEAILYANNEGRNNLEAVYIKDNIVDNIKLELVSNGFVVKQIFPNKYQIEWP